MNEILEFLADLSHNNNREWFAANKNRYVHISSIFNGMVERMMAAVGEFDKDIASLTLKECTYRIYRDTRFSPDKTPYKTHIGAYMSRGGKKAPFAGYYFHVEPSGMGQNGGLLGGSLVACGLYCPEPNVLKSVRDDIFALGDQYRAAIDGAKGFVMDKRNTLKRTPKGFPADSPYDEWLKLKEFSAMKSLNPKIFEDDQKVIKTVVSEFRHVKPFNDLLNRSVDYALEQHADSERLLW